MSKQSNLVAMLGLLLAFSVPQGADAQSGCPGWFTQESNPTTADDCEGSGNMDDVEDWFYSVIYPPEMSQEAIDSCNAMADEAIMWADNLNFYATNLREKESPYGPIGAVTIINTYTSARKAGTYLDIANAEVAFHEAMHSLGYWDDANCEGNTPCPGVSAATVTAAWGDFCGWW